jgi:hypothetical protein
MAGSPKPEVRCHVFRDSDVLREFAKMEAAAGIPDVSDC